jgi:hypothetical protein
VLFRQVRSGAESGQSPPVLPSYAWWNDPENDRGRFAAWPQADGTLARRGAYPAGRVGPSQAGHLPDPACIAATLRSSVEGGSGMNRLQLPLRRTPSRRGVQQLGAVRVGALAVGSAAVGAGAVGALAIGRLAIGRAVVRRLKIEELEVQRLRVHELQVDHEQRPAVQA